MVGSLVAALAAGRDVLIADPAWAPERRQRAQQLAASFPGYRDEPALLIPTSGSSGGLRFAIHTLATLQAAAEAYVRRFGAPATSALCLLPLHHIGGLMTIFRALAGQGVVHFADYRSLADPSAVLPSRLRTTALVPTQLQRLLSFPKAKERLREFSHIFLGGAAAAGDLLEQARHDGLNLCPCYGMTETAAMVAALTPAEFLNGHSGVGRPLPHAHFAIDGSEQRLTIRASSLCHGYWPAQRGFSREPFLTADRASIDAEGYLHIHGRLDLLINSGGEKIDPEEVERALLGTRLVRDAAVVGVPDAEWGERVEGAVVFSTDAATIGQVQAEVARRLAPYQRPKHLVALREIPRTAIGKVDRERLRVLLQTVRGA